MGGGEASRLMETAGGSRAEMPIEKIFHIASSNLDDELTNFGQQTYAVWKPLHE